LNPGDVAVLWHPMTAGLPIPLIAAGAVVYAESESIVLIIDRDKNESDWRWVLLSDGRLGCVNNYYIQKAEGADDDMG
jgi:hypothetical protein